MKALRYFIVITILLSSGHAFSQDLIIHLKNNGGTESFPITEIDSITFFVGNTDCPDTLIDDRDGQMYRTIQINDRCWMAENLNIGERIDGEIDQTDNGIIEKFCYDDEIENCDSLGGMYQWEEMMQYATNEGSQGICPEGWHIPTDYEWYSMEHFLDPSVEPNTQGYRGYNCGQILQIGGSSGFDALLAGQRDDNTAVFHFIDEIGEFWTSTSNPNNPSDYWFRKVEKDIPQSFRNGANSYFGLSVRCIKDI